MAENLLKIISIAKELGLAESTVRFYRDKFLEYIPFEGKDRKRRYPPEAVRVLRFIANSLRSGKTSKQTAKELSLHFPKYKRVEEQKAAIVLAKSQPNQLMCYEQKLVVYEQKMQVLVGLVKSLSSEVISLRKEMSSSKNDQKYKELVNRIQQLETEKFSLFVDKRKISDLDKELARLKRPWWKKLVSIG